MTKKITPTEAAKILQGYNDALLDLQKEWHDVGYSFPGHLQEECPDCGASIDTALCLDRDAYATLIRLRRRLTKAIKAYKAKAAHIMETEKQYGPGSTWE